MSDQREQFTRQELLDMQRHYASAGRDYLNLCYNYLNFYSGILSAILAAVVLAATAAVDKLDEGQWTLLLLGVGPVLVMLLAPFGYLNFRIFYRRFVEASVTQANIEAMLPFTEVSAGTLQKDVPLFRSDNGGFVAKYERGRIKQLLNRGQSEGWTAEDLVEAITREGDTLRNALITFVLFGLIAVSLETLVLLRYAGVL